MLEKIASKIIIDASAIYQPKFSNPVLHEYVFTYIISIRNDSDQRIQLLSRYWHVFDSIGEAKEIEGDGVVGKQPVLSPEETYEYVSGCNIQSEIGRMTGHYVFKNLDNDQEFTVDIPTFNLITLDKLN